MSTTQLLVIGGGPAGLSSALLFARLKRSVIIYDSGKYRNANTLTAHTIPGFEGEDPAKHRAAIRNELKQIEWVDFRWGKIVDSKKVEAEGKGDEGMFVAKDEEGREVRARKVVIATGIKDHLPDIPGVEEAWGRRAIHCIFCHGTETRHGPMGFLLHPNGAALNPNIVQGIFKHWASLQHPKIYIFTCGMPAEDERSGLGDFMGLVKERGYELIPDEIISMKNTPDNLIISFNTTRPPLTIPYIALLPLTFTLHPDASPWLNQTLLTDETPFSPFGTINAATNSDYLASLSPIPPRIGDDPRTSVRGLFWAGNAGSFMANVNAAVLQGQMAGLVAGDECGEEDIRVAKRALALKG